MKIIFSGLGLYLSNSFGFSDKERESKTQNFSDNELERDHEADLILRDGNLPNVNSTLITEPSSALLQAEIRRPEGLSRQLKSEPPSQRDG